MTMHYYLNKRVSAFDKNPEKISSLFIFYHTRIIGSEAAMCVIFYKMTRHSLIATAMMNTWFFSPMQGRCVRTSRVSAGGRDVTNVPLTNQRALMQLFCQ